MRYLVVVAIWIIITNSGYILAAAILVFLFFKIINSKKDLKKRRFLYLTMFLLSVILIIGNTVYYSNRRQRANDSLISAEGAIKKVTFSTFSIKDVSKYEIVNNRFFVDGKKVMLSINLLDKTLNELVTIYEYEQPGPYLDMGTDVSAFKGECPGQANFCKEYFQSQYGKVYELNVSRSSAYKYYYFSIATTKFVVSTQNKDIIFLQSLINELTEYPPNDLPKIGY